MKYFCLKYYSLQVFINNMVCHRCIESVQNIADAMGLVYLRVSLGELQLNKSLSRDEYTSLQKHLLEKGLNY